jgi:hypothetical protein
MPYNPSMARARWHWWRYVALSLVGLVGLVGIVLLVWRVPPALYEYVPDPKDRAAAEASTRTGLIAGLAGLGALGSLAIATRTYRLTQQGQITDRYTKAIEQLGSDKLDVTLGGLYALASAFHEGVGGGRGEGCRSCGRRPGRVGWLAGAWCWGCCADRRTGLVAGGHAGVTHGG